MAPGTAYASGCNTVTTGDWANNCTVSEGADSHMVQAIQILISTLEVCGQLSPDGDFGPATKAVVECFQGTVFLTQDGIVGPETWAALQGQLAAIGDQGNWANYSSFGPGGFVNFRRWIPSGIWYVKLSIEPFTFVRIDSNPPS
jgi:peptidoglycan hydrolase-like protein with peptidoglycan-binding domain